MVVVGASPSSTTVRQLCYHFKQTGSCTYGDKCRFVHDQTVRPTEGCVCAHRQLCYHFKQTGSCTYGDKCRFVHDQTVRPSDAGWVAQCSFFMRNNTCKFGDSCRYSHDRTTMEHGSPQGATRALDDIARDLHRVLSSPALAQQGSECLWVGRDPVRVPPWRRFLSPNWSINHPRQTRQFALACFHALQSEGDSGNFLKALGGTNPASTSSLVRDIVHNVTYDATSFQIALVPFVMALAHSRVVAGPYPAYSNAIYAAVVQHIDKFVEAYIAGVTSVLESPTPVAVIGEVDGFVPMTISQMLIPFVNFLYVLCMRFQRQTVFHDAISKQVPVLFDLCRRWSARLSSNTLYDERLGAIESEFAVDCVRSVLGKLGSICANAENQLSLAAILQNDRSTRSASQANSPWASLPRPIPPGTVDGVTERRRHDNDHVQIGEIRVIPTMDEIVCPVPPALPGNFQLDPKAHWLPSGPARLLDTHFRLLREDMLASMRRGIQAFLAEAQDPETAARVKTGRFRAAVQAGSRPQPDIDVFVYANACIVGYNLDVGQGPFLEVRFSAPPGADLNFWERHRRLENGVMVCLLLRKPQPTAAYDLHFGIVVKHDPKALAETSCVRVVLRGSPIPEDVVGAALCSGRDDATKLQSPHYLLESGSVLYDVYYHVLSALQRFDPGALSFPDLLCPSAGHKDVVANPPLYARRPGFHFDLSFLITKDRQQDDFPCRLIVGSQQSADDCVERLIRQSTMDEGQCRALVSALRSEVSCIQGPPGTGKSYVGVQIVLSIIQALSTRLGHSGPVLVICYTNHALDQFLCLLLYAGVDNVSRIGGRTSSERIEPYAVHNKTRPEPDKSTKQALSELYNRREGLVKSFNENVIRMKTLHKMTWTTLKEFLSDRYPDVLDEFMKHADHEDNDDSWSFVGKNNRRLTVLEEWLEHGPPSRVNRCGDVWSMTRHERRSLMQFWEGELRDEIASTLSVQGDEIRTITTAIGALHDRAKIRLLRTKAVIGATTTGAAKYHHLIEGARPIVLVCEEAGEILESHLLATLSSGHVQQFISIGDHLQLRPHVAEYDLSSDSATGARYRLDMSMFERLQQPEYKFPLQILDIQRRMRPVISRLIRETLYPRLQDGCNVGQYPDVAGMCSNVHFFDHSHPEGQHDAMSASSYWNEFEVNMVVALTLYLLKQGYSGSDITILTPYVRQLLRIRQALAKSIIVVVNERDQEEIDRMKGDAMSTSGEAPVVTMAQKVPLNKCVRVSTIDNFQGEESKVVIISLVRNSGHPDRIAANHRIGFLKSPNRINVLLSRAMHGMFLIGQAALLRARSAMWTQLLDLLDDAVSDRWRIRCQNHPHDIREISTPDMLNIMAPEGGCLLPCECKLVGCGHQCPRLCHADLPDHKGIHCPKPCPRLHRDCQHTCPKPCGDPCGDCVVDMGTVELPCGHPFDHAPCHLSRDPNRIRCLTLVDMTVPACGHAQTSPCYVSPSEVFCKVACGAVLPCGHSCSARCGQCARLTLRKVWSPDVGLLGPLADGRTEHPPCSIRCGRRLECQMHSCPARCHPKDQPCPPCQQTCTLMRCPHSRCNHACGKPCRPCIEPCLWECSHRQRCPMPCGAPCTRLPCNERCSEMLPCGHRCPSVCGEPCPATKFCQVCAPDAIKGLQADLFEFKTYSAIDVNLTPIIVLECGHLKTAESLDGAVALTEFYKRDPDGSWTDDGSFPSRHNELVKMPLCPDCRAPIRSVRRYGRIIKQAAIDVAERIFLQNANRPLAVLNQKVHDVIEEGPGGQKRGGLTGRQIHDAFKSLLSEIENYETFAYESPERVIYDASVVMLNHRRLPECTSLMPPLPRARFLGGAILLRSQVLGECARMLADAAAEQGKALKTIAFESRATVELAMALSKKAYDVFTESKNMSLACAAKFEYVSQGRDWILILRRHRSSWRSMTDEESLRRTRAFAEHLRRDELPLCCVSENFLNTNAERVDALARSLSRIVVGDVFYQRVPEEEQRMVFHAMQQQEFHGTGHWYRCPNGHMYTVGECGMAMQRSTCPECGATIGGADHSFDPGNVHAGDFERRMGHGHG